MSWFNFHLSDFAFAFLSILLEGIPFVLLGTVLSGLIDAFLPAGLMTRALPRNPVLAVLDVGAWTFALMLVPIRVGCLLVGCCFGRACDLPWAVAGAAGEAIHPTQAYSLVLASVLIVALLRLRRRGARAGACIATYLVVYGGGRTLIECFRADTPRAYWGMTYPQVIALGMWAAGVLVALRVHAAGADERVRGGALSSTA